jgi:hypothetical protein
MRFIRKNSETLINNSKNKDEMASSRNWKLPINRQTLIISSVIVILFIGAIIITYIAKPFDESKVDGKCRAKVCEDFSIVQSKYHFNFESFDLK